MMKVFLFQKIRVFILTVWALPIVLLVRILRPIIVIRFGLLRSERIGHFAANTELYLCKRDLDKKNGKNLDVFYCSPSICNKQLRKMWGRLLWIFSFSRRIDQLNRKFPGSEKHIIPVTWDIDTHNLLVRTHSHLYFTHEEEKIGSYALQKLGILKNVEFVCFYARDLAYLNSVFCDKNWDYHDYRDSDISNYVIAAEEMARRGYYSIRMGAVAKDALGVANPKIIDYAKNYRSDFLDIFLSAKCKFFLCSTGGINAVPRIFRRPIAYVNFIPLGIKHLLTCAPGGLFIPKKLWSKERHCFLTLSEILELGVDNFFTTSQYEKIGVEIMENTPEEICALAKEMDDRLSKKWLTTAEDEELQHNFWMLFKDPENPNKNFNLRVGTEFLRKNRYLMN